MITDIEIGRNKSIIDELKIDILQGICDISDNLGPNTHNRSRESTCDRLADIILLSYLLGRRAGIGYNTVDSRIIHKLRLLLVENNELEKHYGDISELLKKLI